MKIVEFKISKHIECYCNTNFGRHLLHIEFLIGGKKVHDMYATLTYNHMVVGTFLILGEVLGLNRKDIAMP